MTDNYCKPTPEQLRRWGVLAYLPEEKRQEALNMPHGQAKRFTILYKFAM
jgi:hypothetical protein